MKKIVLFSAMALLLFGSGDVLQANFYQCNGGCGFSPESDIINGTPGPDSIFGDTGNDISLGNGGMDSIVGGDDNDISFGGAGSDSLSGGSGNDTQLAGPDELGYSQVIFGDEGNDNATSFAGETQECLFIYGGPGSDIANLLGFGPYSLVQPFGQPDFGEGYMVEVDPIAGGYVLIHVIDGGDSATEVVNGLSTPNPPIVPDDDPIVLSCMSSPSVF